MRRDLCFHHRNVLRNQENSFRKSRTWAEFPPRVSFQESFSSCSRVSTLLRGEAWQLLINERFRLVSRMFHLLLHAKTSRRLNDKWYARVHFLQTCATCCHDFSNVWIEIFLNSLQIMYDVIKPQVHDPSEPCGTGVVQRFLRINVNINAVIRTHDLIMLPTEETNLLIGAQ